ncbi:MULTISPECIES: hypothetical protein [unclassified Roseovarius]|uniref:hypothetical protein n=1 Tax=unclassified Roseovarius TaxID=2614913 RepID=UPI00273D4634|nr:MULTISPECIES: hypothetical protein [unclassified Roseovarius]
MSDRWKGGAFQKVIDEHFPGNSLSEWELLLVNSDDLTDLDTIDVVNKAEQSKHLSELDNAIRTAWSAFGALHPVLKRNLETSFSENSKKSPAMRGLKPFSLEPEIEPLVVPDPFFLHLQTLVGHYLGQDPDQISLDQSSLGGRQNCASVAEEFLSGLTPSSAQQRSNETLEKLVLIANARRLWMRLAKKIPPKQPSPGSSFFEFVADLIDATERGWDTESCFKAWVSCLNKREDEKETWMPDL